MNPMNRIDPMYYLKKYLPWVVLGLSGLLLLLSVVDIFSADLLLFDLLILHLAVFVLLLLSLGLTAVTCIDRHTRRPLALLACLLQTPIGGGLLLLYVYEWAFPDDLPMGLILPFVVLLVSIASSLQAGVILLCIQLYEEDDPSERSSADFDESDDDLLYADLDADYPQPVVEKTPAAPATQKKTRAVFESPETTEAEDRQAPASTPKAPEASSEQAETMQFTPAKETEQPVPAKTPEAPESAPAKAPEAPKATPVKVPVRASVVEVTPEDEEDLAPVPKKKNKYQPAFETANRPVVPVVPVVSAVPAVKDDSDADMKIVGSPAGKKAEKPAEKKTQDKKKTYTDPFGLLTEEVKAEKSSVKTIFSDENRE